MTRQKAIHAFLGRNGEKRLNCAEAVASVLKEKGIFSEDEIPSFKNCGSGMAPDGYCGGLYAAMKGLEKISMQKTDRLKELFKTGAGALECRMIRKARKMPCSECVGSAVDHFESLYAENELK